MKSRLSLLLGGSLAASLVFAFAARAASISWTGAAGDGSWHTAGNWTGGVLPNTTHDVVIDVPGDAPITFSTSQVTVRSVQCNEPFVLAGGTLLVTAGATAFNGPITLNAAGTLSVDGAGASIMVNGAVQRMHANLTARRGSRISLPTLTSWVLTNEGLSVAAFNAGTVIDLSRVTSVVNAPNIQLQLNALDGGRVDFSRASPPSGGFYVQSTGNGSTVDASGFTGRYAPAGAANVTFEISSRGTLLMPNVTALDNARLTIRDGGTLTAPQLTGFTRGVLTLLGVTNRFDNLTDILDSTIDVRAGTRLALTNITTISVTNENVTFSARDAGTVFDLSTVTDVNIGPRQTFIVSAFVGSRIDLRRLRPPAGALNVSADGANAVVDLSSFSGRLTNTSAGTASFEAVNRGTLLLPNVTALDRYQVVIREGGQIPITQWTALTRGGLLAIGTTNTFANLTDLFDTAITARNRAKIAMPRLTSLLVTNGGVQWTVRDAETVLDLSSLTDVVIAPNGILILQAFAGSRLDLRGWPGRTGDVTVFSEGAGSVVDLSGFSGSYRGSGRASFEARLGGVIQLPNVSELDGANLHLEGNGRVVTAQLTTFTRGTMVIVNSTNTFAGLRSFQESDVDVRRGGRLALPGITTLTVTNGTVNFTAREAGSVFDLSSVTNLVVLPNSTLFVSALGGGRVDLRGVMRFSEGRVIIDASDAGSMVDLSGLTYFVQDAPTSTLQARLGGAISFGDGPTLLANTTINLNTSVSMPTAFMVSPNAVVLHARPWRSYLVEIRDTSAPGNPWRLFRRVALTNSFDAIGFVPPNGFELRVQEFIANPSILDMRLAAPRTPQVILFGTPGKTYRLESKTEVQPSVPWVPGVSVAMTNSFRIFPATPTNEPRRFFRAREE